MSSFSGITVTQQGEKTIVSIDEVNVDFRNCANIRSALNETVNSGRHNIILNLSKVEFMDSSGLGVLIFGKRVCEEAEGSFALCSLQNYVTNLVTLTNLNKSVPVFETEPEALASS